MLTRLALALVLVASVASCKSKQAAKSTTPPPAEPASATESGAGAPEDDKASGDAPTKGDPCDGGEVTPQ